jgi:hypothetical protein
MGLFYQSLGCMPTRISAEELALEDSLDELEDITRN